MKIREEFYQENQEIKQRRIDAVDRQIHNGLYQTFDKHYRPKDAVSIQDSTKGD